MSAVSTPVSTALLSRRSVSCAFRLSQARSSSRRITPGQRARLHRSTAHAASPFTYCLAASSVAKKSPPRPPKAGENFWNFASSQTSAGPPFLRSTKRDSGEDAFFVSTIGGSPNHVAFGVTDGVGGWQDQGVDPSDFSQGLCSVMAGTAHTFEDVMHGKIIRPVQLLQTAYDAIIANPRVQAGGSTASLACADNQGIMDTANLGDSGYLVFGPGKVTDRSIAQTHAFNTPYQMSKIPAKLKAQHAIFGGATHFSETPAHADLNSHQLKHGDIVVFATDGVWDNLSAQDTLAIVTRLAEEGGYWYKSHDSTGAETLLNDTLIQSIPMSIGQGTESTYLPGQIAGAIMREAKSAGLDRRRDGPFAKEVKMLYPHEAWEGGKPDDIAVVVCVAVQENGAMVDDEQAAPPQPKL